MFKPVTPNVDFPKLEEEIIKSWKENKIFEKSLAKKAPKGDWTFLDGPPFVTGTPHYGSLLSSIPKDVFGRYFTMKGYRVRRVWGWDGHGLPIENKVETVLGIGSKKEIENRVGVKKFIEECKKYVNEVSAEWEWYVDHVGRWVDFKNAYKTWDTDYMESVMWIFKQMYEKGYIYKGLRVTLYCPRCATPISNFEIALDNSYKEVPDPSTTYKFQLANEKDTYILAWSTTPWNKIVTPALAVNPKLTYVKVKQGDEYYILAKSTLKMLKPIQHDKKGKAYEIVEEFKGKDLVGKKFVPHYDYYKIEAGKKAFVIIGGDFVTAEEGTGVVTIAAYGEEDLKASLENNIHLEMHVDEEGTIKPDVPKFGGMYYLKANKAVNEDLSARGLIYKNEKTHHNVPICWRCNTRLYYVPLDAWFVDVQKLKPLMKKTNEEVNWFPEHFKHGRFLKSLESAPDWNISRNRYWGSPVPVWECACGERFVPGAIKELEERSGKKITDLHKPFIDEIIVKCKKCGKEARRTPEVLDSWIEAGSASFAERHFPFNTSEKLEDFFPPDFVAEYTGQIRAWFYVMHVIGAALYQSPAFKNVGVEGVILGTDGRKMSKNFKNYPDPKEMLQKYGGDALRLYLLGSPVMHGEDIIISEEQYKLQVRGTMLILWNVYNFFVSYAIADKWQPARSQKPIRQAQGEPEAHSTSSGRARSNNVLDQWIMSLLNGLIEGVTKDLEVYDTVSAVSKLTAFVDNLSTWYIRRSRDRVGPTAENEQDKQAFYNTCYDVLVTLCKVIAPITPFLAEEMYRNLTGEVSVHVTNWPESTTEFIDISLEKEMEIAKKIVAQVHAQRKLNNIKVRQPLQLLSYDTPNQLNKEIEGLIADEVNVKEIEYATSGSKSKDPVVILDLNITPELRAEGQAREIVRAIQAKRKEAGVTLNQQVIVTLPSWPKEHEEWIKKQTLTKELHAGKEITVSP